MNSKREVVMDGVLLGYDGVDRVAWEFVVMFVNSLVAEMIYSCLHRDI